MILLTTVHLKLFQADKGLSFDRKTLCDLRYIW